MARKKREKERVKSMKREKRKYLKLLLILCSMVISMSFTASASVIKEIEDNYNQLKINVSQICLLSFVNAL